MLFAKEQSRRGQCEPSHQDQVRHLNRAHAHPQPPELIRDLISHEVCLMDVTLDVSTLQGVRVVVDESLGPFLRARLYYLGRKEKRGG